MAAVLRILDEIAVTDWHCMGCGADYDGDPEAHTCRETPGARNDTRSRSQSADTVSAAQDGAAGERTRDNPRAAGAASARGAQPSGRRVTICQLCRKRLRKQRNGAWYHRHNASEFCHPGDGTHRKAVPFEIGEAS
jgi:hypothetical protein